MKKYLVRVQWSNESARSGDMVLVVRTRNIIRYLAYWCKDILDEIDGCDYDEISQIKKDTRTIAKEDDRLLLGDWIGGECLKEALEYYENKR